MNSLKSIKINLLSKAIRIGVIFTIIIFSLILIQITNRKYENNYVLIWSWFILTNLPLIISLIYLKANHTYLVSNFSIGKLRIFQYCLVFYYLTLVLTIFVFIPLSWLNAGIGYRKVLIGTIIISGFVQSCFFIFWNVEEENILTN